MAYDVNDVLLKTYDIKKDDVMLVTGREAD